jgi:integrase
MLPGAHRVAFSRAGKWRIYWYADRSRGAPCFWSGAADTRISAEALERAASREIAEKYSVAAHPRPAKGFVSRLVSDFRGSNEWKALAPRTQRLWGSHLDNIQDVFGATSLVGIQRKGTRKLIRNWHASMSETPRKANTALTVLVRLFEHGLELEDLERNPAAGMARLDEGEGRAGIVWSEDEFRALLDVRGDSDKPILGPARRRALELEWLTGLRREDLIRLRWDEIDTAAGMIRRTTLKSGKKKRIARISITPELRALLEQFPKTGVQVVTSEEGGVYSSPDSFSSSVRTAFDTANIRAPDGRRKHLHDMRGTRASKLFATGASDAEAEVFFGWAPGAGAKMRGVYGDPETIAQGAAKRQNGTGGIRVV